MNNKILFTIMLGLGGTIFLVISFIIPIVRKKRRAECTEKAKGKIIRMVYRPTPYGKVSRSTRYYPIYRYWANKRTWTVFGSYGEVKSAHIIGEKVAIYYSPENPEHIYIPTENTIVKKYTLIFRIVGIGLLAVTAALIIILLTV